MTVSTHEMTILCLIEMTEESESLHAIIRAATKRLDHVKRDGWIGSVIDRQQEKPDSKKKLYTWTWINGGFNQHYAHTEAEAIEYAETMCNLKPNMNTFKHEPNDGKYWADLPSMD